MNLNINNFHKDNHFVPQLYLKCWESSSPLKTWVYRTLVSHQKVPLWKESSIGGVAYHSHLYTRIVSGEEIDDIEKWFDSEFETPAKKPIEKVMSGERLTKDDWYKLIRFVASQDVRTPKRLIEGMKHWNSILPKILDETLKKAVGNLKDKKTNNSECSKEYQMEAGYFPLKVETEFKPGEEVGLLKAETVIGRGIWLFSMRRLLNNTAKILHQHKWTILKPPQGYSWFTSDCPVVKLNFHSTKKYDFGGGWGSKGSEIFMPISSEHLLYTQVGHRPPDRGSRMAIEHAKLVRRFIAENAHRMIFASKVDDEIPNLKPRVVNKQRMENECLQWKNWHKEQTEAENKLME